MAQENVEVIRAVMRGFNERDESLIERYDEQVEYRLIGGFAELAGPTLKGREAVLSFAWELIETLGAEMEIERLCEVDDRVLLIARTVGAGDESGVPIVQRWGQVYTFRAGKIVAVDNYWNAADALEAVELSD
jgi:ketosteroid isomerase-like protein